MCADSDDLAPLVQGIHDLVVAPDRLETLLDIWSSRLHHGSATTAGFNLLDDPQLATHVEQAEFVLRNVTASADASRPPVTAWVRSIRSATVAVTRSGYVVAANAAATETLGLKAGCPISVLGLTGEDHSILLKEIYARPQRNGTARMFRLRRPKPEAQIVLRIIDGIGGEDNVVGLITTIVMWPDSLTQLVRDVFLLTAAEADVLRGLAVGQTVKEIGTLSGRSEQTIRTHVSALLVKTETHSQVELIRMTLGLVEAAEMKPATLKNGNGLGERVNGFSALVLEDQRRLDYLIIGDPRGAPFILLPGGVGASPFPPRREQELFERGLKMIIPIRAGFGQSSPLPPGRNVYDVAAHDTFALMDHLGIAQAPFMTICDDFHMAIEIASIAPERMSAIISCGAPMPPVTPKHFQRMSKWSRFVSANARHAPRSMPYVALAFFSLVRRLGTKRFLQTVMADSPADLKQLDDDEVISALTKSSEVAVTPHFTAHVAWAAENLANFSASWSDKLRACPVPITCFAGHQDPFSPIETVKDYAAEIPNIRLMDFPDCGQLLYPYVPQLFDVIEAAARSEAGG